MSTNVNNKIDGYHCTICNKKYKDISGLWKHNVNIHQQKDYKMTFKKVQNVNFVIKFLQEEII